MDKKYKKWTEKFEDFADDVDGKTRTGLKVWKI